MQRTFEMQIIYPDRKPGLKLRRRASDHRNAVMLLVNEYKLHSDHEVEVREIIELPKSTYCVIKHVSHQIEMKC